MASEIKIDSPKEESLKPSTINPSLLEEEIKEDEPYTIFTRSQQIRFLTICALTSAVSPLTSSVYVPALNQIERSLGVSTEKVNLTISVFMVFQAISPTFWCTIADSYGRRPVLVLTMLIYTSACIGLAFTKDYTTLLVVRMVQAFGSSSVIAVGAGILGDIADVDRRGSYFGIYNIGQMSGPVIGPIIGGVVAQELGWHWIFWILTILGSTLLILIVFFVPETLRALVGNGSGYANPTPYQWFTQKSKPKRIARKPMNFLKPFIYFRHPDVLISLLLYGNLYMNYFYTLTSTAKQFEIRYHPSEAILGLCFIPQGAGNILGSFLKGKYLDYVYRKHSDQSARVSLYSARLKTAWIELIVVDAMLILYGWCMHLNTHIAAPLLIQFVLGLCMASIMVSIQTMIVDLFPGAGASITASNNLMRCILGAVATVSIEPGIQSVGIGWMFTIVGLVTLVMNICIPVLLSFGPKWKQRREESY